jgi:murein DD-endopeptidase MepM/ murein hydrolase activator NlpD
MADCGTCLKLAAAAAPQMPTDDALEERFKGYDITATGLRPAFPKEYACSPLTSLYASWIDVDGTRRDERHSGIDGGRLGDAVLAPAPGTVRRVWIANWGQGREGALLMAHTREDLNLTSGPSLYYTEFDHLRYRDIRRLKEGDRIERGQQIGRVFRPGGKRRYLPEVHLEVYAVDDDEAIVWKVGQHGTEYFENPRARLIDPFYLLSLEVRPNERRSVAVQPFDSERDYSSFKGFTYHLPCHKRVQNIGLGIKPR